MHTVYSDGKESIEDMARAGMDLGYEYVAVTDHSKGLRIAGGIDEEALAGQMREIDALNDLLASEGRRFRVLRSPEMNLGHVGSGDMQPDVLGRLDLVLGSFHFSLRLSEDQTDRYLAALENPDIDVLGHPRSQVQLPHRLEGGLGADLREGRGSRQGGRDRLLPGSVGPRRPAPSTRARLRGHGLDRDDAHDTAEMSFMPLGLAAALKAGLPKERILNFMPYDKLRAWTAS